MYVHVCVCVCVSRLDAHAHICYGAHVEFRGQYAPIMWVPGIERKLSGFMASTKSSYWFPNFIFKNISY